MNWLLLCNQDLRALFDPIFAFVEIMEFDWTKSVYEFNLYLQHISLHVLIIAMQLNNFIRYDLRVSEFKWVKILLGN